MRKLLLPLFLLSLACASQKAPDGVRPDVQIRQISGVPPAARFMSGGLPVHYVVRVRNNSTEPITLERIRVESVGLGAYTVSHSAPFSTAIQPAQAAEVNFWAAAQRSDNVSGANGPVTLRVVALFDGPSGRFEDVTVQNVAAGAR